MKKEDKERVVAELTERLRTADTLIVADYRGLTMPQIDDLRGKLLEHGARFAVVKNTLTRRAAEAAGADALLALLEGPSAIAFIESDGDMVAVAKALADSARDTKVLEIRGGILEGRTITGEDVEELAKLPPLDVLRGQVLAAVIAPLTSLLALVSAPLQNLVGLIDARIDQLGGEAPVAAEPEPAPTETPQEPETEAPAETAAESSDNDTTSQVAEGDLAQPEEEDVGDGGS
jgi:large subunit ribosomal protein L10